jgi:hypothetical protein
MCLRSRNSFLINTETVKAVPAHCKAYHCKECGPIKASSLRKALTNYLSTWKTITFWTITIKQDVSLDLEKHHKALRECWRRFLIYVRRDLSLSPKCRKMLFIKVVEEHTNGYIHYHLACNTFFPYENANYIWNNIVEKVTGIKGKNGNIHIKAIPNPKKIASYITKYIVKMSLKLAIKLRRYSKSNGIKLFPVKTNSPNWIFAVFKGQTIEEAILEWHMTSDLLVYNKHNFTDIGKNLISSIINCQEIENLATDLPINKQSAWQYLNEILYDPYSEPNETGDLCLR